MGRVRPVLAFAELLPDLTEVLGEGHHLLACQVILAAEHDDPAREPQLAQERHHLGISEIRGEVDAVDDGADGRLHRFELQLDPADGDRLVVDGAETARDEIAILGEYPIHHFPATGTWETGLGNRPQRARPGWRLVGLGTLGVSEVQRIGRELRVLRLGHDVLLRLPFGAVNCQSPKYRRPAARSILAVCRGERRVRLRLPRGNGRGRPTKCPIRSRR